MSALLKAYCANDPALTPFYEKPPQALCLPEFPSSPWEGAFLQALRGYQERLGLERTLHGTEHVIVTGQQPGLLTGPLYTIYKAITTLKLAQKLDSSGQRVLPVFWVGSDDHDFEEVQTARILTRKHELLNLSYTPQQDIDRFPMYRVPLEASLHGLIDEAADQAPGSEWRGPVQDFLHESLQAASSFSDWNARILARLFAPTELILFTPDLSEARRLAASLLLREIDAPLESTRLLNAAGQALEAAGFAAQVVKDDDACNFFVVVNNRRSRVRFEEGAFVLTDENLRCTPQEMRVWLERDPEAFSPNVALRCLVQQRLFPTLAYVAGPGELAYWGQLKPLFAHFGLPMPVVYPRAQARITSIKLKQILAKLQLDPEVLDQPAADLEERVLRNSGSHPAGSLLEHHGAALEAWLGTLEKDAAPLHKRFKSAQDHTARMRESAMAAWDRYERALARLDEGRLETVRQQLRRTQTVFAPLRKPQERVYSVFSYFFEYGWDLIPRLTKELDVESFETNEIEL